MTDPAPNSPTRFRTGGLSPRKPTRFDYAPDGSARAELARQLGLLALKRLHLAGEIRPVGRDELVLTARLTAAADQSCVVTLKPVAAAIDEEIHRRYVAGLTEPQGAEVEMPEDDTLEPMPEVIDLAEIAAEALALALPLYPRAPGAELGEMVHSAEGVEPLRDDDMKPFAGLSALAARLGTKGKPDNETDD